MPLTTRTKLGPYEIIAPIGAGGMGEVYRARDTRLGRDVAIKILPQHLTEMPDAKLRFEREARAVSSLNHPHICTLHDIGHQNGTDFLVMEFLEGETLAKRLEKGPLGGAEGRGSPRLKAGQHHADETRREADGFWAGKIGYGWSSRSGAAFEYDAIAESRGAKCKRAVDRARNCSRHVSVHGAGADGRERDGRTQRYFFVWRGALRDGNGAARVRWKNDGERDCGDIGARAARDLSRVHQTSGEHKH